MAASYTRFNCIQVNSRNHLWKSSGMKPDLSFETGPKSDGRWPIFAALVLLPKLNLGCVSTARTQSSHQFRIARIGVQRIERGVRRDTLYPKVVFVVSGVEPLEGMVLVAQINLEPA